MKQIGREIEQAEHYPQELEMLIRLVHGVGCRDAVRQFGGIAAVSMTRPGEQPSTLVVRWPAFVTLALVLLVVEMLVLGYWVPR